MWGDHQGCHKVPQAILIAVDMPKALQAKCKTCFGRMILHALSNTENILFQNRGLVFYYPPRPPPPPPPPPRLVKGHTFYGFFFGNLPLFWAEKFGKLSKNQKVNWENWES